MKKNLAEWFGLGLSIFMIISSIIIVYGGQIPLKIASHSESICEIKTELKEQKQKEDTLMIRTAIILYEIRSLREIIDKK